MLTLYIADYASVPVIRCSPPSWMAHLTLAEKGLAHRVVRLRFDAGEHRTPEMLALNPRGSVPILVDGEQVVHETLALLEYVEFVHPAPALLPPGAPARGLALTRLHEAGVLKDHGRALFGHLMRGGEASETAALGAAFEAELGLWEQAVADQPWVAGPRLSLADIAVFTYVACAVQLGLDLGRWPCMAAFYTRMRRRSAVRATWPETWTTPPPATPPWPQAESFTRP
ncbi:MAG: glutathione S-transferase family protein [Myxococcales bacterium]|nr:glutathione S-transferase family protein [Myxococcales bacterium]MCB9545622.1 glutathione S-transferase family protein [Myxococcales bacterium]